jgi:hypothetical protein
VELPLVGTVYANVPIITDVLIDLTVSVPIDQTIPIDMNVPVQLDVPISIQIADTPLAQTLTDLKSVLDDLFVSFSGSVLPTPAK